MEAAKNEGLRYYISSDAIKRCFNQRGFNLKDDEAGVIAKRFEILVSRMRQYRNDDEVIGNTICTLKNGIIDYFLVKKVRKTYKNLNDVMDKTWSQKTYKVTKEEAEELWKREKKEIAQNIKELENAINNLK